MDADFADWVRQRRQAALLTQEELAERSQVSVRTIQMIESGRTTTRSATRRQLIDVLGAPPPRVLPAQLPCDTAVFAGRLPQLTALDKLLGQELPAVVISAVSGIAGVGKTTLAVHWAHRVAGRFPDGQLYVNLRGFDPASEPVTPAEAVRGFLGALGVPADQLPPDLTAQVALYRSLLAGKRVLVILDNARDAAQVRPLLPGARGAFTLITSRSRLTPLVAGEGATVLGLGVLSAGEAYELLASRLGADRLAAEPEAADRILEACAGLPLALAIAAARVQETDLPLTELADELHTAGNRVTALDAGDPASQVGAVFSWSYETLGKEAARLFRLLGLDPAPRTAAAAAALLGRPVDEVRRLLDELVRANLVTLETAGRFTMHDLLRAYAADQARATDSADARAEATLRLLDHYAQTAHAASRQLYPHRDPIPLPMPLPVSPSSASPEPPADWLPTEYPVLLDAIRFAASAGYDRHAWWLAWCLDTYLYRQGHWHELEGAWRAGLHAADRIGSSPAQAYALRHLARPVNRFGRFDEARELTGRALDLHTAAGDQVGQADAHNALAVIRDREGDLATALHHVERAFELYRAAGHRHRETVSLHNIGWLRARLGDLQGALDSCTPALDMFRRLGDRTGLAGAWSTLGYIQHRLGRYPEADDAHREGLAIFRDIGDRYNEGLTLASLGDTRSAAGDVPGARQAYQESLDIFVDLGQREAADVRRKLRSCGQTAGPLRGAPPHPPLASSA